MASPITVSSRQHVLQNQFSLQFALPFLRYVYRIRRRLKRRPCRRRRFLHFLLHSRVPVAENGHFFFTILLLVPFGPFDELFLLLEPGGFSLFQGCSHRRPGRFVLLRLLFLSSIVLFLLFLSLFFRDQIIQSSLALFHRERIFLHLRRHPHRVRVRLVNLLHQRLRAQFRSKNL